MLTETEIQAIKELDELREWKRQAMEVMPDFQEIGRLLNIPLGHSVHDKIIPALRNVKGLLEALENIIKEAELGIVYTSGKYIKSVAKTAIIKYNESLKPDKQKQ